MMSCCAVTFVAVKAPARPLVEEFLSPLLFGLTEITSKATSVDVGIGVLWAATIATANVTTSPVVKDAGVMTDSLDVQAAIWLN